MKKILAAIAVSLLCANAFALERISFDQNGSVDEIIEKIQEVNPGAKVIPVPSLENAKAAKKWTVMVFVNAKNNLEYYGLKDVNEMEMVGSSGEVNIVAELGRISGYSSAEGDWKTTRRYLIEKDDDTSNLTSPVLMELENTDMGDWKHLVDFAKWSMTNFPAEHYMLIVWNHGSGWNKDSLFESTKGLSYDDETGNHMTTPEIRMALEEIGKIDIFSMDACLMQMIEVAYEIRNNVDYVVASEETEPGDGYTYDTFLAPLIANPGMDGAQLGQATVDSFVGHYQSIGYSATHSVIKTAGLEGLKDLLNGWVTLAMTEGDKEVFKTAKSDVQDFYYRSNKDLYHFLKLVAEKSQNEAIAEKSQAIMDYMDTEVISYNRTTGSNYANAYGLAIYIPYSPSSNYSSIMWGRDSNWNDFIGWLK